MERSDNDKKLSNIELLSKYLNMDYYYQHIYRNLSINVHSVGNIYKEIQQILGGNNQIIDSTFIKEIKEPINEVELSSFVNYIVSRFIEISSNFIDEPEQWKKYEKDFKLYYENKWN